jgi:hypothetical protein
MIISHERFYNIALSDDDILEMAVLLESVVEGLGDWYLDTDPDGEIQRDLVAAGRLFWERRGCIRADMRNGLGASPSPSSRETSAPAGTTVLRSQRLSRGWSQKGVAAAVGLSQGHVCFLESGRLKRPDRIRPATRAGFESLFGVPLHELLQPERCSGDLS